MYTQVITDLWVVVTLLSTPHGAAACPRGGWASFHCSRPGGLPQAVAEVGVTGHLQATRWSEKRPSGGSSGVHPQTKLSLGGRGVLQGRHLKHIPHHTLGPPCLPPTQLWAVLGGSESPVEAASGSRRPNRGQSPYGVLLGGPIETHQQGGHTPWAQQGRKSSAPSAQAPRSLGPCPGPQMLRAQEGNGRLVSMPVLSFFIE